MSFVLVQDLKAAIAALPAHAGDDLHMETLTEKVRAALPELLKQKSEWRSLFIDYEPPFLMRLYRSVCVGDEGTPDHRRINISLHYFFGSGDKNAPDLAGIANPYDGRPELADAESKNNYHPHPWAATFLLLEGGYHQQIGKATAPGYNDAVRPVPFKTQFQQAGNDDSRNRYTFNDPLIWHRVLPNGGNFVSSVMVTYIPQDWNQTGPKPAEKQRPLSDAERAFMFSHFEKLLQPLGRTNVLRLGKTARPS